MVGGGCPGSITINYQTTKNYDKLQRTATTTKTIKNHQNLMEIKYQNYQKAPKPGGNQREW
jgi:hypothetical protein